MLCRASSYRHIEGTRIVRIVRNCSPNDTLYHTRSEFLAGHRMLNRLYARAFFFKLFPFPQLLHLHVHYLLTYLLHGAESFLSS